jgi:uncharacterized protein
MSSTPVPLSQVVLKVHSRCDLACDHCYVYEGADQSWRGRPMAISDEVISRVAQRVAEHAASHGLGTVRIVLHGGEPLLAGRERLERVITGLESALGGVCGLDLRIHTNGVRLDEEFCELFAGHGVRVGVSVDGDRAANDRHRRYADGRSSYDQVVRAVGLLRTGRFRDLYAGLLCTIDIANDPVVVYESLMALDPPQIDFLLPHATWENPPARTAGAASGYADWLIAIYGRWVADGRPVAIRTFESVLSTLAGGDSLTEALGLTPAGLVVIETDGTYEQADSLKTAFDGAPATGLDVFHHSLDAVGRHPGITARQQGLAGLCRTCQQCPVVTSCGGGLYAHRYRAATGFDNPSVYCPDLLKLITHITSAQPRVAAHRPPPTHVISGSDFAELAAGYGGAGAMTQLIAAQHSLRRVLLSTVYQAASTTPAASGPGGTALRAAWTTLTTIDQRQPEALDAVLSHPYVRVWAVRCLEQLKPTQAGRTGTGAGPRHGHAPRTPGLAAGLGHLGAIAAVAAIRAGADADVTVPVIDAAVHLPTLGRLAIGAGDPTRAAGGDPGTAAATISGGAITLRAGGSCWTLATGGLLAHEPCSPVTGGDGRPADWQPVRMLRAPGLCVALEDTDPYRDCHQWRAAPRLTDPEFARWQRLFADAWHEIGHEHPAYAPALAAGLGAVMPLSPGPQGRDISAAARHAFGAVASALPDDPVTLALLVIHEFQHVKLGAVLDLYDLYDQGDSRLFHAPWREDPRPLEGLLQGTYAHLAVTDFWRSRHQVATGPAAETARHRFTYWRAHTCDAIETLADSGSLTPLGMRFVDEMRQSAGA